MNTDAMTNTDHFFSYRCLHLSVTRSRRGFTFIELLVAIVILALILASVIPFIMATRETSRRAACAKNLMNIQYALSEYRRDYGFYPRTRSDADHPAWTAYTGADDANPFAPDSAVQPNDVTACLWLLVRIGYLPDTQVFICPSSDRFRDPLTNAAGKKVQASERGNFKSNRHLAYSILSPFNPTADFEWTDTLPSSTALMADMNPGILGIGDDVTKPTATDAPEIMRFANSRNHAKTGQNVLYPGGNVEFVPHAFVGRDYIRINARDPLSKELLATRSGDNIYTSLQATPNIPDGVPAPAGAGAFGKNVPPSWKNDSYLLPSDDD